MRLIDADALRDFLTQDESLLRKEYDKESDDTILGWIQESEFIQNKIQEMPTVDAERHGHWEAHDMSIKDVPTEACSICGAWSYGYCERYCPHCGAKMDEVEE